MLAFHNNVEAELTSIHNELHTGKYYHGAYRNFLVCENKKRFISVAPIRDRVIHRLLYDYLVEIYDKTFDFDLWSCRLGKGLNGAINRLQSFSAQYKNGFFWRADIRKYFDSIDQEILLKIISKKISESKTGNLVEKILLSYGENKKGIPIGNLTSQVFANIYLNEFDRYVRYQLKPKAYLRYGDDFILFEENLEKLKKFALESEKFLQNTLKLKLHPKNQTIKRVKIGIKMLGIVVYPKGRKLNARNKKRLMKRLNTANAGSYLGLIEQNQPKMLKLFHAKLVNQDFEN